MKYQTILLYSQARSSVHSKISLNEFVIQKLNLLVIAAVKIKFKSAFVLGQSEITLKGQNCFQDIYI